MMKMRGLPVAACVLLSACGGGGGHVETTLPPAPAPSPTPSPSGNTSMTDLQVSQKFSTDSGSSTLVLVLPTGSTISADETKGTVRVQYDAKSNSYSVAVNGRSQTFSPGDILSDTKEEAVYRKPGNASSDRLTLVKVPYDDTVSSRYVQTGYWQHNETVEGRQNTEFSIFTFGLDTPVSGIPKTGTAAFRISTFGVSAAPGNEPRTFQGSGEFTTDFLSGVFSAHSYNTEAGLVSGDGVIGGGIEMTAAGHLGSKGSFSGAVLYEGYDTSIAGTIAGRFYGPNAEEVGAAFSGSNESGAAMSGAFTGRRDNEIAVPNFALTDLRSEQMFYSQSAILDYDRIEGQDDISVSPYVSGSNFTYQNPETFSFGTATSNHPSGQFTIKDKVASDDPNFVAYRKTISGQTVEVELYKVGAGNTELALTYTSLGRWRSSAVNNVVTSYQNEFIVYGFQTAAGLLRAKTGSATYNGVVYGAAANRENGSSYTVAGTSRFNVNFSDQTMTGALALKGTGIEGTPSADFGTHRFSGNLSSYGPTSSVTFSDGPNEYGNMDTRFYGPTGEEIGGTFEMTLPSGAAAGTTIAGATVAKRK